MLNLATMLSIRSFAKSYDAEKILSIDRLDLSAGIYFIKGDNGAGKTTLFKCLSGISPFTGEISINDVSAAKDPVSYRYLVNYAEAEPVYPAYLTARDLMRFVGRTKNASSSQIDYYKERLGIGSYYEKPCGTYSSGMLKKLSLALAFLGDPEVIVLDEPLITLDAFARQNLFHMMEEKTPKLFFISSHQALTGGIPPVTRTYNIEHKTLVPETDH